MKKFVADRSFTNLDSIDKINKFKFLQPWDNKKMDNYSNSLY